MSPADWRRQEPVAPRTTWNREEVDVVVATHGYALRFLLSGCVTDERERAANREGRAITLFPMV